MTLEQVAYERGFAAGRETERGRVLEILNAQMQTAAISQERANARFDWQGAGYHQRVGIVIQGLINIVNQQ